MNVEFQGPKHATILKDLMMSAITLLLNHTKFKSLNIHTSSDVSEFIQSAHSFEIYIFFIIKNVYVVNYTNF